MSSLASIQALGQGIDRCLEFQHFGLQQHLLEQGVDAHAGLGRHGHERRIATVFFGHNLFDHQLLLDAIGVGIGFVGLGDRHNHGNASGLGVLDGFLGLGHDSVVRRHHQNHDIGSLGTTGTHGGERLVTGGIQEGNHAARRLDVVGADVLRDAARFAGGDLRAPDVVEQRSLAVEAS